MAEIQDELEDFIKMEEFETLPNIEVYMEEQVLPVWDEMKEVYIDVMISELKEGKKGIFFEPKWLYSE